MRRTSLGEGGGGKGGRGREGWGQETGKETAESKNVKQEIYCRNTKFFCLPLSHIQRKKYFHPILVLQSQLP